MSTKAFWRLAVLCGLLGLAPAGWAATTTTTFAVTGTVVASCTVSATALSFGAAIASPIAVNVDAAGSVTATCTNLAPYTVGLSAGTGAGATVASRKMTSGANLANYSLFRDAARLLVWGTTIGTDTVAGTGNGAAQAISVFGRIFSGQATVPAGAYTDTITVTVTF